MQRPLQLKWHNVDQSDALAEEVRGEVARLEHHYGRITGCDVTLEAPSRHHRQSGSAYRVRVELSVPGDRLVVGRVPPRSPKRADLYAAVKDAFREARRQLEDYVRRLDSRVKTHAPPSLAVVARIDPEGGYGFLRTPDGRDVYFHEHSVLRGGFRRLAVGSEVRFVEEAGDEGPQASTVTPVHPHRKRPAGAEGHPDVVPTPDPKVIPLHRAGAARRPASEAGSREVTGPWKGAASPAQVLETIRHRLGAEPRIDVARHAVGLSFEEGVLTMEGELSDLGAKKLALERAAAVPGVEHIVDRLRVVPARRMSDAEIRDHVRDLLLEEPALQPLARTPPGPGGGKAPPPEEVIGSMGLSVSDGVVTLDGRVPGLAHKRLAGVLAWWVPGVRDVVNGLEVVPPEADDDGEITDAVRIVLEKDPLVDASQIGVASHDAVVTLRGVVHSDVERRMAEWDAWCVFGVDLVKSEIEVRA